MFPSGEPVVCGDPAGHLGHSVRGVYRKYVSAWANSAQSECADSDHGRSLCGLATLSALLNLVGAKRSQDTSRSLAPGAAATGGNDD